MTSGRDAEAARRPFALSSAPPLAVSRAGLRHLTSAIAVAWCLLFVVLTLRHDLHFYGDGALFAYGIAVRDAWAFHWHNIAGRSLVYLYAYVPAEAYVGLTGNVSGAVTLYALLFFSAPLLALAATFSLDRSRNRTVFAFACASTAVVLPLVFGFPTEMWIAHSLFWPTLSLALFAKDTWVSRIVIAALLTAVGMTHGGGMLLAFAIVGICGLRGLRHMNFVRAMQCLVPAALAWIAVYLTLKPDAYFAVALPTAAYSFIDYRNFDMPLMHALAASLVAYGALYALATRLRVASAHVLAAAIVAIGLVIYWKVWDQSVLTEMRYPLRTSILIAAPLLGALAAAVVLREQNALEFYGPQVRRILAVAERRLAPRMLAGALVLVTLVHAVETAKFTAGWAQYKRAVRALAMSEVSDPNLGDRHFVSSARLGAERNLYAWSSTTHFLTVLLAPGYKPARLIVDPEANYFWLSCATATANLQAGRAIPAESRALIRAHACRHRP